MSIQRKGRTHANVGREVRVSGHDDTKQLLEMAFGLHQSGELVRARGLYERVIEQEPDHADALHFLGLACFQEGDGERGVDLIRRAIAVKPDVVPYHDNIGAVLESRGALEEALEAYREAARLGGEDAERSFNMGVVLGRLGRLDEAEAAYRDAIRREPGDAGFHFNLANVLKDQGRLGEAVGHYRMAIDRAPASVDARNNLGNALQAMGRLGEAVDAYRGAIEAGPESADPHVNLASLERARGNWAGASAGYERALGIDPARLDARQALGEVQYAAGNFAGALDTFRALLERTPRHPAGLQWLASTLRYVPVEDYRPDLCRHIAACFDTPEVQVQDLAAVTAAQLRARHGLDAAGESPDAATAALGNDPLFERLMTRTVNVDPRLERFLVRARDHLLSRCDGIAATPALQSAAASIAVQCFVNEFVFPVSAEVHAEVDRLRGRVEEALGRSADPDEALRAQIAVLGMYVPLVDLPGADALQSGDAAVRGEAVWPLVQLTVIEPLEERRLAETLPRLEVIADDTSKAVRAQYEEHPYPRWLELPVRPPVAYGDYLRRRFPHFDAPGFLSGPVEVLAAGCGTGQEAIAIAAGRSGCDVLAIDLSRRSLAYGARMAGKLGLRNVSFMQADILDTPRLERRFHIIETTGVLHHMADPEAGWRALTACLVPGGLMRVGLYSERARADVVRARDEIRTRGLSPVSDDIRAFRAEVLAASPGAPLADLADLARSEDLYTMNACRDLLFHVHEHRFTIPKIAVALERLSLEFIGFDSMAPGAPQAYRGFNPADTQMTDLAGWERFESERPELFASLYVFWCRKR